MRDGHQVKRACAAAGAVGLNAALLEEAMKNFALKLRRFLVSEDGPTAVEYAVMLALIIVVCLTAIQAVGTNAASTFNTVAGQIGTTGT